MNQLQKYTWLIDTIRRAGKKMIASRRNLINQYAALQREILSNDIADCKRIEHPLFEKYTWLIDTIRRAGKISHKDLSDRWSRNKDFSDGHELQSAGLYYLSILNQVR